MEFRGNSSDSERMELNGELTVGRIPEIRERLLSSLQEHAVTEIDVRGATAIDPAFLQLLCSAHRTARSLDKRLIVLGLGLPLLRQQVGDCGFVRHIGCHWDHGGSCIWVIEEGCA